MTAAAAQATADIDMTLPPVDLEPRAAHPVAVAIDQPSGRAEITPMTLLELAVSRGDLERAERFWALAQKVKAEQARDAFTRAMVAFKRNAPDIYKSKTANFGKTKDRGAEGASYAYADHATVVLPIAKGLAEHGFSHDWLIDQPGDGYVHVTCVLTHEMGHEKHVHMWASPDTSGGKNGIQSISSANSYLQRITLLAATGLSTQSMPDDDGHGAGVHTPAANDERSTPPARTPGDRTFTEPPFDVEHREPTKTAHDPAFYTQAEFDDRSQEWIAKIRGGREADRLMDFVESRGKRFTDAQKKTLRAVKA